MLRRKSRRNSEAESMADLIADAQRLDYGGAYARELQHHEGEPEEERVPPQLPRRSLLAEWYYER